MPRTCSADSCKNNVFSHGFCQYHGYMRRMKGGDLYQKRTDKLPMKLPKKQTRIPRESKKRREEHIHYSEGCKLLEQELRDANGGRICDFFTGREIKGFVTWHHLLGRSGDYYLDKDLLVPAENDENDGHLFYHRATLEQLMAKEWYQGFLIRLKSKSIEAYNKEMRRGEKTILFKDEEE